MKTDLFVHIDEQGIINKKAVKNAFDNLNPGKYLVTIENKNKRTSQQNRYLHGVLLPIVKDALRDAGWNNIRTLEDAKDFIKVKFLIKEFINEETGEIIQLFSRTSELNKEQFSNLVDDVSVWLWEYFNISLPLPGQQAKMFN